MSAINRSTLAVRLDISKGRVSQLLTSKEEPSAHLIAKLMVLTGLPFDRLFKIVKTNAGSAAARAARKDPIASTSSDELVTAASRSARRDQEDVLLAS